jgi:Type I phosphodiesterase / nucleotide pyrophosphatase
MIKSRKGGPGEETALSQVCGAQFGDSLGRADVGDPIFTPQLKGAIQWVDGAIGSMVKELRSQGVVASTTIIITAKHGQSPIDPSQPAEDRHRRGQCPQQGWRLPRTGDRRRRLINLDEAGVPAS